MKEDSDIIQSGEGWARRRGLVSHVSHAHPCIKSKLAQTTTPTSLLEEGKEEEGGGVYTKTNDYTLTLTEKMAPMSIL